MNILNIITRCTRPDNLYKVKESIFKNTTNFIINWYILFDTSNIREINSEILTSLSGENIITKNAKVFPNPFTDKIIIDFTYENNNETKSIKL